MIRFFWQPEALTHAVLCAARAAGFRAVCDLTGTRRESEAALLVQQQWTPEISGTVDFFTDGIGEGALSGETLRALCENAPDSILWIDTAFLSDADCEQLSQILPEQLGWVISSPAAMDRVERIAPGARRFALKGNEAGGFVGSDTIFTLFATVRARLKRSGTAMELFVWGAVATPEAAAAFLTTGAAGVIFESLHWLTDEAGVSDTMRKKLEKLRADHTRIIGAGSDSPYRLFDKGNSAAARTATALIDSSGQEKARRYLSQHAVKPLSSRFDRRELIPLGVEAAFAASFVRRFGRDLPGAVMKFRQEVQELCARQQEITGRFADSPTAKAWGTRLPFLQGAMSWITDSPEFAAKVAEAGALPTLAMGMMGPELLQRKFSRISEILDKKPYAVNIIMLPENPCRQEQLAWILKHRPRFAVIAAGEPAQGKLLLATGIDAVYIAPTEDLMQLALETGYRHIICEGCESGGHIGSHSTLTLAQLAIDLKNRRPDLFTGRTLILAGGICNRETACMAAMLGADAIQMGTAYLTTREIVETGVLSELYQRQILESAEGATVITGESVGLRVRSLRNPKTAAILELERSAAAGSVDREELRLQMEELTTGSLCSAARGIDARTGRRMDPDEALREGQFMSGICAGILHKTRTLAELHAELAGEKQAASSGFSSQMAVHSEPERIAITGMSVVNALGRTPSEIWESSLAMRSGIRSVPPEKWNHERYYEPRPLVPGRTYCRAAAFHGLRVGRKDIDVPPQDFKNMTEATKIALWIAGQAVSDSHILDSKVDRHRIGVILSQNVSEMTPIGVDLGIRDAIPGLVDAVRRVLPLTPEQAEALEAEFAAGRSIQDDTSLLGRLSSMVPGFICNKFGFTGPSYSVQAACASSLVALHSAVQMMRSGLLDAALVGGGEEPLSALHFLDFSVLGALAGITDPDRPPEQMSRPFDRHRDGFVMGEGAGMILIERESVARRRGAFIYGYITGVGAANTDTGMVESSRHSQIRAIQASFAGLPYGPESVDLVECHATSTRQGDLEEVWALKSLYPNGKRTVLAGFKSQIGHTLGAAGINSLIRGVMAMNAGIYPATLNCKEPDPALQLEGSGLTVLTEPAAWDAPPGRPRRFQVDAFGFGGSNFVVQLEQAGDWDSSRTVASAPVTAAVATLWPSGIQKLSRKLDGRHCRIAVLAETQASAEQSLADSGLLQNPAALTEKRRRALARQGIHISGSESSVNPAVALVFPGQGSQYVGMGQELSEAFPAVRDVLEQAGGHFGFDISQVLFASKEEELRDTRRQQPAVFALEVALAQALLACGLKPAVLAGHSLGMFAALCIAGVFTFADGCRIVNQRALCMEKAGMLAGDPGAMLAVHAGRETVESLIAADAEVFVLNINAPLQTVIGGSTDATLSMGRKLSEQGLRWSQLPVGMAFHSPIFQAVQAEFAEFLSTIPFHAPEIPVLSNHTAAAFPADTGEIRRMLAEHMYSPVDWLANVRQLATEFGIHVFVEAGPREALGNLIRDALPQALCLPVCLPSVELQAFRSAIAQLYVEGALPEPGPVTDTAATFSPLMVKQENAVLQVRETVKNESRPPVDPDTLESVIAVILQTTGYERDEVEPDMDLRDDLAIRSSRLPVIADALETRFSIKMDLQDFAGVRTVRDIAERIPAIQERRSSGVGNAGAVQVPVTNPNPQAQQAKTGTTPLRRIIFDTEPLYSGEPLYLQFSPLDTIGVFCPRGGEQQAAAVAEVLRRDHGVQITPVSSPEQAGTELSGLMLWLGNEPEATDNRECSEEQRLLLESFLVLQAFLASDQKKAVVLFHQPAVAGHASVLAEGIIGMLLCMAWEYRSVLFRAVRIETESLSDAAVRRALDRNVSQVILRSRSEGMTMDIGREMPPFSGCLQQFDLGPDDVVAVSGGGAGILREWMRALIPFGCRMVLLGRTELSTGPEPSPRVQEIRSLMDELSAAGIETVYLTCDVADPEQTERALAEAQRRYGKITGVIHGAGILRDNYTPQISAADFAAVLSVKLRGAANLFRSGLGRGLRFFTAVSSVAAAVGNPGQSNYAAANRAMTAYLESLRAGQPQVRFQSLLLAPVEGGGMADTEEIRALMRLGGYGYIHAKEAAAMFCRELVCGDPGTGPVLFARELPQVPSAPPMGAAGFSESTDTAAFPLLDDAAVDWKAGSLTATRTFSNEKDLWLTDHKPLLMLKHPLVSGVMMLEAFAEAARFLHPYLTVSGFRDVRFIDIIECPDGRTRVSRIDCRTVRAAAGRLLCKAGLQTRDVSPSGRELEHWIPNSKGKVVLGTADNRKPLPKTGFPVPAASFTGQTVDRDGLTELYEQYTALQGRYRVLDAITGIGADSVEVRTILQESTDFAGKPPAQYQVMPYLLEALFHAVDFQTLLTMEAGRPPVIVLPYAFAAIDFYRQVATGESCRIQARCRSRSETGVVWDAAVYDGRDQVVLTAQGLEMRWLSL